MKNYFLLLSYLISSNLHAQTVRHPIAGMFARSQSYSSAHADAASFSANQAALAGVRKFSAAMYGERRFMLKELSQYRLAFALPTTSGNFGLSVNYLGESQYSEILSGLAYARRIGKIDLGVQFTHFMMKIAGYGNTAGVNFEAGCIVHITEQLQAGAHVYNPIGLKKTKSSEEKFPVVYSAGVGYDASENFFIGILFEKDVFRPVCVNVGLQYVFEKKLFTRIGIVSGTSSFYLGTGVSFQSLRIELITSVHPQLGITPAFMMVYKTPIKP